MEFPRPIPGVTVMMTALIICLCVLGATGYAPWFIVISGIFCALLANTLMLQWANRQKVVQAITELKSWKDQSKLILRAMGEGMFCVDLEGKVTLINAAALRMLGWNSEDLLGQQIDAFIRPPLAHTSTNNREKTQKPRVNEHFGVEVVDEQFMRRNGTCFPVAYTCSPIVDHNNNITGAVYIFRDDTEHQRYESELREHLKKIESINRELADARERAERANNAKGVFLANMSHEIRTPLNGVIGVTSLLERTELNEKQKKHVQRIRLSGQLLMDLINDILDYSKIESKELKLEHTRTDLHQLLHDVVDMLSATTEQKKLELTVKIGSEVPKEVLVDSRRLRQILVNIIGNATKFTEHGYVHITLNCVAKNNHPPVVRMEIKDTGIGIPKDKQAQLFQKFYQADDSTTRKHGGTGLGLAICKQLVDLMQGAIGIDSTEGVGSTVWIELPLEPVTKEVAPISK